MEQTIYAPLKVNNEIELCEITNLECKQMIERRLLQERISYFIRWVKPTLFHRNKNTCIICVHDDVKELAEDIVRSICDEAGYSVKFLLRKSQNQFL